MTTEHDATYPLYLYEFRFLDPVTGKWRKARYRAEVDVIRQRYANLRSRAASRW